eukprot:1393914-Pleurochrysis_carterae.AAC.4
MPHLRVRQAATAFHSARRLLQLRLDVVRDRYGPGSLQVAATLHAHTRARMHERAHARAHKYTHVAFAVLIYFLSSNTENVE